MKMVFTSSTPLSDLIAVGGLPRGMVNAQRPYPNKDRVAEDLSKPGVWLSSIHPSGDTQFSLLPNFYDNILSQTLVYIVDGTDGLFGTFVSQSPD